MSYLGFTKSSGPVAPLSTQPTFGNLGAPTSPSPPNPPFSDAFPLRSTPMAMKSPSSWGDTNNTQQRPTVVTSVASSNSGTSVTLKVSRFQDTEGTNFPRFPFKEENSRISNQDFTRSYLIPVRPHTPEFVSINNNHGEGFRCPFFGVARPTSSLPAWDGQNNLPRDHATFPSSGRLSVVPNVSSYVTESRYQSKLDDAQFQKGTRLPPLSTTNEVSFENSHFAQNNFKRSNVSFTTPDSQGSQRSPPPGHKCFVEATALNPSGIVVTKRTRSPPLLSRDQGSNGNSYTSEDSEREQQAKARRLARFKVELSENVQGNVDATESKVSSCKPEQSIIERSTLVPIHSTEAATNLKNVSALSEYEAIESSSVIIGLCTDMCPEMERAERERKGDLDWYERLDGDRNQTSKYLAVKKYTRTAEREARLIRPMPILQKTINYLLNLLDQPYNEKFLGMYNFLWDRMRAIRMDLRMQHIFNEVAVTMLEQMVRLHIIAMHELCEYSKGEGFSEGFDSHLNIEQMNKTSVELFQMYDNHRKKGINIPTEKEFRGYYALLKLDKHPGYIVEPAELSLDLAKMTSEMRQTKEVLFARDVARACRTGNFIAFFRLAKKASYLQACLMHAHFAKLRTQALASIHAGQNNQGLPVSLASKWLSMEEEDMESLLDYHGFLIKVYEEPYMVKKGPFLNGDKDYPTRRSKLVNMKKSGNIIDDVLPSTQVALLPTKEPNEIQMVKITKSYPKDVPSVQTETSAPLPEASSHFHAIEKEICDPETITSPKEYKTFYPIAETPGVSQQDEEDPRVPDISSFSWGLSLPMVHHVKDVVEATPSIDTIFIDSSWRKMDHDTEGMALQVVPKTTSPNSYPDYATENSMHQNLVDRFEEEESPYISLKNETDDIMIQNQLGEIAEAKLKLILRLWKRHSSNLRELREQRQLATRAALSSLSLGLPIQPRRDQPSTAGEFDIDQVLGERCKRHEKSWSEVNVSDVIAGTLSKRNPNVKCLCWKIAVCSQMNNLEGDALEQRNQNSHLAAALWLHSKLMPSIKNDDGNLLISSSGLAIWKKWVPNLFGTDISSCFSVVKDTNSKNLIETVSGASAILFLVSGSIPWKFQKEQLHMLLTSIPPGSCLPLLILSASYKDEVSDASVIFDELSLYDIENSRISSFKVVLLIENEQIGQLDGFFSDKQLREGLRWLASESPLQLKLYHVKTHDLALTHLGSSLDVLDRMNDHKVSPNDCVTAFNEALDQSIVEIITAAKANPINWPCPEIASLEDISNEHRILKECLPSIGWSSSEKIAELVSGLKNCKLPFFTDDLSFLSSGSNTKSEIENHRRQVEHSLIRFLSQSTNIMGLTFVTEEAQIMLQRCSHLELHDARFYIVPKWVMIFRRIINWRLMSLASGAVSQAYILERPIVTSAFDNLDDFAVSGREPSAYYLTHPSLDEMIEMVCNPLHQIHQPLLKANQFLVEMVSNGETCEQTGASESMDDEPSCLQDGNQDVTDETWMNYESNNTYREVAAVAASSSKNEADKLSMLLEKCNIIQDKIEEKLSIYF